jgi:hypothetical protein
MMHRRKFVGALACGLAISRSHAEAQTVPKMSRVGFLLGATGESVLSLFHVLKEGLRELGYVEGRNMPSSSGMAMARWNGCRILLLSWCG